MQLVYADAALLRRTGQVVMVPEGTPGAAAYVGVGWAQGDTVVRVVDPETCQGLVSETPLAADRPLAGQGWLDT